MYSLQVSSLVVGAGSSLSYSPGRGREKCLAAQFPQGMGVKSTLLVHFLLCKHCMTSQLSAVLATGDKAQQDIKNFITSRFPRSDLCQLLRGFGMTFSLEERRNIFRVNFGRG